MVLLQIHRLLFEIHPGDHVNVQAAEAQPPRLDHVSAPFRNPIRTLLTVPAPARAISRKEEAHRSVLEQLLQLDPAEFERLVVPLLDACGDISLSLPAR